MANNANVDINITKVLIYAVGGLAVIGGGLFIWRKVKKGVSGLATRSEQQDVVKEARRNVSSANLTHDNIWFETASDRIMTAFKGAGTTERTVKGIFKKLKTDDDVYQLISAFGTRKARSGMIGKPIQGNLATWLEEEMPRDIDELNDILTDNEVKFQF